MKIRYQVSSMSKFKYRDSLRFIFGIFISQLDYLVQEFTYLLVIDFGVYYLRNLILGFSISYNWYRSQLYFLWKRVRHGRFEHGHMENQVNRVHRLWEMKGKQQSTVRVVNLGCQLFHLIFSFLLFIYFSIFRTQGQS